ncbi:hypothetical protein AB2L27_03450 [Kineococcus sp. LSe6-4]|uniref:Uncharacterized protein n=1 Tax=Kineococcus halophytocola TaxID=3234027 RepID=A0ABV4H042_9ACTN
MALTPEPARPEPPQRDGERETLAGFLDVHRATFAWKVAGLDADLLRERIDGATGE